MTSALTNEDCSPYGIQCVWNNYAMAHGVANAETKAGDRWFFGSQRRRPRERRARRAECPAAGHRVRARRERDARPASCPVRYRHPHLSGFDCDQDERARAWSQAFLAHQGAMPTMNQAGAYSATRQYLNAVERTGTLQADKVCAALKDTPVADAFTQGGVIRDNGSLAHDVFLMQVKAPGTSSNRWDIASVVRRVPADEVFQPLAASTCKLIKR